MNKKRPLTKQEAEMTNGGVLKRELEIKDLEESIMVNEEHSKFIKAQRAYEDKLKPYNRKVEDKNSQTKLQLLKEKLDVAKLDIKNLKNQLKYGVQIKEPVGIN